jgi:ferritin-like metal-binding protein YciE
MAETAEDQLVAYLKDAHALEQMSLKMTEKAAKQSPDEEMRRIFAHHHEETENHERMIRERIEAHGESPSMIKDMSARMAALGKGLSAALPEDTPGRLARDGYVQEETEIASYELLRRVAQRAGDIQTMDVATQILENERQTADRIAGTFDRAVELSLKEAAR